jgi:hypothetical protein
MGHWTGMTDAERRAEGVAIFHAMRPRHTPPLPGRGDSG